MTKNYWFPGLNGANVAEPHSEFGTLQHAHGNDLGRHNEKIMICEDVLSVSPVSSDNMIGDEDDNDTVYWCKIPSTVNTDQSAEVCVSLRQLQRRRGCSNALLKDVLQTLSPYLRCFGPAKITDEDKRMQVFT